MNGNLGRRLLLCSFLIVASSLSSSPRDTEGIADSALAVSPSQATSSRLRKNVWLKPSKTNL